MLYNENGVKIKILKLGANTLTTPERRPSEAKYIFVLSGAVIIEQNKIIIKELRDREQITILPNTWHCYRTTGDPAKLLEIIYD